MALSESQIKDIIRERCDREGRAALAQALNVNPSYISMILSKRDPRPITESIAEKLGYRLETSVSKVFLEI